MNIARVVPIHLLSHSRLVDNLLRQCLPDVSVSASFGGYAPAMLRDVPTDLWSEDMVGTPAGTQNKLVG